ncbi:MAG: choice-of-anchor D domain-containing protein [Gemmatimonadaceae bacterium]
MRTEITTPNRAHHARARRGASFIRLSIAALCALVGCVDPEVSGPTLESGIPSLAAQGGAQILQTGIECGCTKVGPYVSPATGKTIGTSREGASPGNVYQLSATQIGSTISLQISRGATPVTQFVVPLNTKWGFSPDDQRFVYHYLSGTAPNQTHNVFVYNLAAPNVPLVTSFQVATGASQITFSPHGKYLMYAWLTGTSITSLTVVDAVTGAVRHQASFTFQAPPGTPGNTFGMASWGFSPDAADRTLAYLYIIGPSMAQWNAVNLTATSTPVLSETAATGFWQFSPCGDLIGAARQTSLTQAWVYLSRTLDGSLVNGAGRNVSVGSAIGFSSTLANHFVTLAGVNQPPALTTNTADDPCQSPVPILTSLALNPASLQGGATSTGTVTLSGAAPASGVVVTLASTNPTVATVPPNVTVTAGNTSASFTVQTSAVTTSTPVTLSATASGVTKSATLTVNAPPQTVRALSVTPPSLAFGNQPIGSPSASQAVTVSSTGNASVNIQAIIPTLPYGVSTTCPATLSAGASCKIYVTFTPVSVGAQPGTLTLTSDAVSSPNVVSLSGTGFVPAPGIGLSATSISFGSVKVGLNPSRRTLTVTSTGSSPLVISSATIGGVNSWDFYFDTDSCTGATLAPGASCTISMYFEPLATGNRAATLSVSSNASATPSVVTLTGVGLSAGPVQP